MPGDVGLALVIIVVAAVLRWVWDQATGAAGLIFPLRPPKAPPPPPLVALVPPPHHTNGHGASHHHNGHR